MANLSIYLQNAGPVEPYTGGFFRGVGLSARAAWSDTLSRWAALEGWIFDLPDVTEQEFRARVGARKMHYVPGLKPAEVDHLVDAYDRSQIAGQLAAVGVGGVGSEFVGAVAGSLLDPVNLAMMAAGSAIMPLVRAAATPFQVYRQLSTAPTFALHSAQKMRLLAEGVVPGAARGVIEGTVSSAIESAIVERQGQREFGLVDLGANIGVSAILGGIVSGMSKLLSPEDLARISGRAIDEGALPEDVARAANAAPMERAAAAGEPDVGPPPSLREFITAEHPRTTTYRGHDLRFSSSLGALLYDGTESARRTVATLLRRAGVGLDDASLGAVIETAGSRLRARVAEMYPDIPEHIPGMPGRRTLAVGEDMSQLGALLDHLRVSPAAVERIKSFALLDVDALGGRKNVVLRGVDVEFKSKLQHALATGDPDVVANRLGALLNDGVEGGVDLDALRTSVRDVAEDVRKSLDSWARDNLDTAVPGLPGTRQRVAPLLDVEQMLTARYNELVVPSQAMPVLDSIDLAGLDVTPAAVRQAAEDIRQPRGDAGASTAPERPGRAATYEDDTVSTDIDQMVRELGDDRAVASQQRVEEVMQQFTRCRWQA